MALGKDEVIKRSKFINKRDVSRVLRLRNSCYMQCIISQLILNLDRMLGIDVKNPEAD